MQVMSNDANGEVALLQGFKNVRDHRPAIEVYQPLILSHPAAFPARQYKSFYVG